MATIAKLQIKQRLRSKVTSLMPTSSLVKNQVQQFDAQDTDSASLWEFHEKQYRSTFSVKGIICIGKGPKMQPQKPARIGLTHVTRWVVLGVAIGIGIGGETTDR
jgi:hypothetical protein